MFGVVTFLMALVGHQAGRTVANLIPTLRTDILTGIAFVAMAGLALVGVGELWCQTRAPGPSHNGTHVLAGVQPSIHRVTPVDA